ncbi:MAG: PQQ-dependent sugar dehydrogenase [Gammaproteobacteria bacterium]|nr:PQQ-dependent sugar dehydrogenase [Gammaproteobacteria bacterium]MDH3448777.1 PQQ-dependent sugar dehydrogenase [Gammaproteobacteria bacterium]
MNTLVKFFSTVIASTVMFGLSSNAYADEHEGMNIPTIKSSVFMSGLENPWDMAFLPDGTMFFTEKCKGLSVRTKTGSVNALYGMKGSKDYADSGSDLFCEGQAGMLGVVADINFAKNRTLYVYSTSSKYHGSGCKTNFEKCNGNIVMKFNVGNDLKSVSNRTDIVTDIQYKPFESNQPFGGPGAHNGGRLRIGPGGFLWVTGGDRHRGICPQDGQLLCGKVLRIDGDGNAHPGNNPPAGFDKRIYTYGHRNVQGIDFRPSDGRAFTAEHGPWHNDEITALVNGGNAGWDPAEKRGGRGACPDQYCGYEPKQMEAVDPAVRAAYTPMSDTRFKDLMPAAWNNNGFSQGTGSAAFLKGSNWGIYEGRLTVGIMGIAFGDTPPGSRIDIIDLTPDGLGIRGIVRMPLGFSKRFRGLVMGPDNALYAATDEGEIYRITAE